MRIIVGRAQRKSTSLASRRYPIMLCSNHSAHSHSSALWPCKQETVPPCKAREILHSHFLFNQCGESLSAQLIMVTTHLKHAPACSRPEVLYLIGLRGEESVLDQLRVSKRDVDIYEKVSHGILEKGHNRDAQQCCMKIKVLRQAYHKIREANSCSGSSLKTCCFYEELHAILGRDPTIVPPCSIDTLGESEARMNGDESVDEEEDDEEENRGQVSGVSLLPESKELVATQEQPTQRQETVTDRDAGEGTYVDNVAFNTPPSHTPAKCLSQRRWKKKLWNDMFNELMNASAAKPSSAFQEERTGLHVSKGTIKGVH
ncbi:uncharacterized protein [Emydura macquarii macquarii]|uniref:uncharacterized protein n=1 Tax=Emydura macquarii macquarii TaxID=1129001 RepID=UPI003529D729